MSNKDGSHRIIYNISVTSECYRELQHMEIDERIKIPQICAKIIEKFTSKRVRSNEGSKIIEMS